MKYLIFADENECQIVRDLEDLFLLITMAVKNETETIKIEMEYYD